MSQGSSAPGAPAEDPLVAGREALDRHDWQVAFDQLTEADRRSPLPPADLERLTQAAFFTAQPDLEVELKERAFREYSAAGDPIRAAYLALDIARANFYTGRPSIGSGWVRRAERLLPPGGDTYAHGYLILVRSEAAGAAGEIDTALTLAEEAVEIGERVADADLRAYALSQLGTLRIATGATSDGLALLEEATVSAVNGELTPFTTGVTACRMIATCRDLTDYKRANEWIEATEKYCARQALAGFPGVCRIHRAEVAAVGGAWERAEAELEKATREVGEYNAIPPQADGYYAIGDIRRLKGDFVGAEAALREAHARGRVPQPALALIRLAQGDQRAAAAMIEAAATEQAWDRWARSRLLPAQVEIAIATGDVPQARSAVDEFGSIVATYPSPALEAGRMVALGRVLLAEGDAAGAARELRGGVRGWRDVGAPYEVARARVVLGRALRENGDEDGADLELQAAIDEFERLGAGPDGRSARFELRAAIDRRSGSVRRTFMFTDIVGSTKLAERLGDVAWETLLRRHDDAIRRLVDAGDGEIVNSTGDGFFVAFDTPRAAVDCAIAIQRAVRDLRATLEHDFMIRIGIHTAEATRRGTDYSGIGVHVAARVGALAGGDEIIATTETLAEAGIAWSSDAQNVEVKGVSAPVRVATIGWD